MIFYPPDILSQRKEAMELESVVESFRNGDRSQRDIIINELLPLAEQYGRIFSSSFNLRGFKAQELIAEAYLILVELVDNADIKLVDNNIIPYIRKYLPLRLKDFLWEDNVVVVPASTHKLLGVERTKTEPIFEQYRPDSTDIRIRDLMDDINHIIETDKEREYVAYKMAGYQNNELVSCLGMSLPAISRMRSELHKRYTAISS